MACSSCGGAKVRNKVRVTSTYIPKPKVSNTEILLSLKVEKEANGVQRQTGEDNKQS
jgi:hypothetical protein